MKRPFALAGAGILLAFCTVLAVAQKAAKPSPSASPTTVSTAPPFYSVDDAQRLKFRELEFRANQLEIEIQRLQVKIEQNKAAEAQLWRELQTLAAQYAKDKQIDPDRYDFDAGEIRFIEKKKP